MSRALADALDRILRADERAVMAATMFTPAQRRELDSFARQTGALRLTALRGGSVYLLIDPALARAHLAVLRPTALADLDASMPARTNNIARMRNSKGRGHAHGTGYLLLKAIGAEVMWRRGDGAVVDISAATALNGAAAIAIKADDGWHTDAPIWLVENQALFDRLDWLPADAHGSIVYYGGQLSKLLLEWMALRARGSLIVSFPDYDGVGLFNYARLREKSLAPVEFWLMPNWDRLLRKYGSNRVWQSTRKDFVAAVERLEVLGMPMAVRALCQAMSQEGLALEHEAVWLLT
ncbi:MAG: hypothetical protein QFF03_20815 [Pseudomonadota bacterium]|nr:hypothetical protein [Pseudomonadota bacterium]